MISSGDMFRTLSEKEAVERKLGMSPGNSEWNVNHASHSTCFKSLLVLLSHGEPVDKGNRGTLPTGTRGVFKVLQQEATNL